MSILDTYIGIFTPALKLTKRVFPTVAMNSPRQPRGPIHNEAKSPSTSTPQPTVNLETATIAGAGFDQLIRIQAGTLHRSGYHQAYVAFDHPQGIPAGSGLLVTGNSPLTCLTRATLEREIAATTPGSRAAALGAEALKLLQSAEADLAAARHQWTIAALEQRILESRAVRPDAFREPARGPGFPILLSGSDVLMDETIPVSEAANQATTQLAFLYPDDFKAVLADRTLTAGLRKDAENALARLEGVHPEDRASPDRAVGVDFAP